MVVTIANTPFYLTIAKHLQNLKLRNIVLFRRRHIYKKVHYCTFNLDLRLRTNMKNIAQYPLHHMTYAPAKFEVAMSNGLGGDAFARNI